MPNISEILAADLAATAFDTEAVESPSQLANYTPAGSSAATEVTIIAGPIAGDFASDENNTRYQFRDVMVLLSEVTNPAIDDVFLIDGQTWKCGDQPEKTDVTAKLRCRYAHVTSLHGENHKRRLDN